MKLNKDQKKLIADVFGQISAAWFIAGIIAPFFVRNLKEDDMVRSFLLGFLFFLIFFVVAIYSLKK